MSTIALDNDDVLMRKMQSFRMDIIEDIMAPPTGQPDERLSARDPKLLRVALTAMDGVDNSIQKQRRLDLDKQAQENDGDFQRNIVGILNQVMSAGGMALNTEPGTAADATVPVPQLGMLPTNVIDSTEALIGVEHIEYDDIMTKKKS